MKRILLAAVFLLPGCQAHEGAEADSVVHVEDIPAEIKVPSALWSEISGGGPHAEGEAASEDDSGVLFMPVDVILTAKNEGVLTASPLTIHLPRGGGAVDLSKYVTGRQGSFFVRFAWPDADEKETVNSWFVSRARRRKMGDELWGAGCHKYFRITAALARSNAHEGLKVNTTRNRHLSVLGGHFVFAAKKGGQTFTAQVTFDDPRFPELFCGGQ